MPKLPDATVLGGAPSAASGRQVSNIDGSALGRGMQSMANGMFDLAAGQAAEGRGYANMGRNIAGGLQDLSQTLERAAGKSDDLTDLQNRGDYLVDKINLDAARDKERDPAVLATYPQKYKELQDRYASKYVDPTRQQKFRISTNDDLAKANAKTGDLALQYTRDGVYATSLDRLKGYASAGARATDPAEKEKFRALGQAQFDELERQGVLTKSQAVEARQKWVENYSIESILALPPEQRLAAVKGWKGALTVRESGGDPTKENQYGFAGTYQFGAPRLQALGVYKPGASEDLQNWSKSSSAAPGKWSGTFDIPGFPNVRTKADFLANPAAQEAVFQIHEKKMDQEIAANGFDKYIGKTVGGVQITREGLQAMMHLGGAGGTDAFLTSGGVIDRADANGTKLSDYARIGMQGPSKMTEFISPGTLRKVEEGAIYDLMKQNAAADAERRQVAAQQKAQIAALQNDLEVGLHDGVYTRADIMKARSDGWLTDFDAIKKVEGIAAAKEKEAGDETKWNEVLGGRRSLNQFSEDDQAIADIGVKSLVRNSGGQISEPQAAMMVYEKSRIMPKEGVVALRGALASQDVDRVKEAASVVSNILASNPTAFRGQKGADDLESDASAFKHYAYDQGLGPDAAAKKIIESKTDDYKRSVKVSDPEAKKFKEELEKKAINDLANGVFEGSGWFRDNIVGANPGQRAEAALTYSELATDNYRQYGDPERAKAYALDKMKKIYGVSNGVLTKYPAEMAYPPVNGSHSYIYDQASAYIATRHPDQKIDPKTIQLSATTNNRTAMEFLSGGQPPYQVQYSYKVNGQTIYDTMPAPWRPDVKSVVAKNIETQQQQFTEQRQAMQPPSPVVRVEDTKPTGLGGRVRPQAEREAEAAAKTEFRTQRMEDVKKGAGDFRDKQKKREEWQSQNTDRTIVDTVGDWWKSTPPLKDAMPKIQLGPNRNRLPGKPN